MIKLVPQGTEISRTSSYFTTETELNKALAAGRSLQDYFGLPSVSHANNYDAYRVAAKQDTTVFTSHTAPTSERTGGMELQQQGGGKQTLILNRNEFDSPIHYKTVENPVQVGIEPHATQVPPEATLPKGLSPSGKLLLKGAGAASIALMAYDLAHTGHKYIELRAQGNDTGAESAAAQMACASKLQLSRNAIHHQH